MTNITARLPVVDIFPSFSKMPKDLEMSREKTVVYFDDDDDSDPGGGDDENDNEDNG